MKPSHIIHIITTIERGGAELSLLRIASSQTKEVPRVTVIFLKGKGELIDEFSKAGVEVLENFTKSSFSHQIILLIRYLKKTCTATTIVHAHLPRAEVLSFLALTFTKRLRFCVTRHNAETFWPNANVILSSIISRIVQRDAEVTAISKAVRDYILKAKEINPGKDVKIIYYSIDEKFELKLLESRSRKQFNQIPLSNIKLGTVARLAPQKRIDLLIKTFHLLWLENPSWSLHILGGGKEHSLLMELTHDLGLDSHAKFYQKSSEVGVFLNSLDCFVLTSSYEGFGLVLLEAMSANLPIFAPRNSAIPEVLGNEHPGLVGLDTPEGFASHIQYVLNDARQIACMQKLQESRLNFFQNFPETLEYLRLYELVIATNLKR